MWERTATCFVSLVLSPDDLREEDAYAGAESTPAKYLAFYPLTLSSPPALLPLFETFLCFLKKYVDVCAPIFPVGKLY